MEHIIIDNKKISFESDKKSNEKSNENTYDEIKEVNDNIVNTNKLLK